MVDGAIFVLRFLLPPMGDLFSSTCARAGSKDPNEKSDVNNSFCEQNNALPALCSQPHRSLLHQGET